MRRDNDVPSSFFPLHQLLRTAAKKIGPECLITNSIKRLAARLEQDKKAAKKEPFFRYIFEALKELQLTDWLLFKNLLYSFQPWDISHLWVCLVTKRSWVRIPPGAGLFSFIFLSLYLSLSLSGVSSIRSLKEVQHN